MNDVDAPKIENDACIAALSLSAASLTALDAASQTALDACLAEVTCVDLVTTVVTPAIVTTTVGDVCVHNAVADGLQRDITVTCADLAGVYGQNGVSNVVVQDYSVNVIDNTPPTFIGFVSPEADVECEATGGAIAPATTCTDICPNPVFDLTVFNAINIKKTGVQHVNLKCQDTSGNLATEVQEFNIVDTTDPTLVYNGDVSVVRFPIVPASESNTAAALHEEQKWTCAHDKSCKIDSEVNSENHVSPLKVLVVAADSCCLEAGHLTSAWKNSDFNPAVAGQYIRTFTATDCTGNTATLDVTIELYDTGAPVVTVQGCDSMGDVNCVTTREASSTASFTDVGAKCVDYVDGVLTPSVEVTGDIVDLGVPGTYTITYSCDDFGGQTGQAIRTVEVGDNTPPHLFFATDQGSNFIVHEAGEVYTDAGCTMQDTVDATCVYGAAGCDIVKHGDTVSQHNSNYDKNSCSDLASSTTQDGTYIVSPQSSTLKRQQVACVFGTAIGHVTAQRMTSTVAVNRAAATIRCASEFAAGSSALKATDMNEADKASLALILDTTGAIFDGESDVRTQFICFENTIPAPTSEHDKQAFVTHVGTWVINFVGTDNAQNTANLKRTVMVKDTLPPYIKLTSGTSPHAEVFSAPAPVTTSRPFFIAPIPATLMAESSSVNGYFMCAVASAVAGVALLGFSAKKNTQTMVPV